MAEGKDIVVNKQEVEKVSDKLQAFAAGLESNERDLLAWIIARAQAAEESDVQAYNLEAQAQLGGFRSPLASNLVRAAGFRGGAGGAAAGTYVKVTAIVGGRVFEQARLRGQTQL